MAGIVVGLGAMAAFLGLPRVTAVLPEGDGASSLAPVVITFNRPMNHQAVESRFKVEPVVPGAFSWDGNSVRFTPGSGWPPGTIRVSLAAGAASDNGLPLLVEAGWEFSTGTPRVAFLLKADEVANVWMIALDGGELAQITNEATGVEDFAVSPDGTQIVYVARRADGGGDLRRVNRDGSNASDMLACPNDLCAEPVFSLDGAWLAFERRSLSAPGEVHVEVIGLTNGETVTPADLTHLTGTPRFARDGRLSYLNRTLQAIGVYDFNARFTTLIPTSSGEIGSWSPDGQYIVYPEIIFPPEPTLAPDATPEAEHTDLFYSHLLRVMVATNAVENLSGGGLVEDASPAYSPSGKWLAFGRKKLEQDQWTPGKQLWLMRTDGSDARPLTDEPFYNHSAFVWSPDETLLVYMRFDVTDPSGLPELWAMNADGANPRLLVTGGYLPEWMP
jgi:TolB protein